MAKAVTYILIEPDKRQVTTERFGSLLDACRIAQLPPGGVDHGSLPFEHHSIVVYEYGLLKPIIEQRLFAIGNCLYEGNAVVYAEIDGDRVDADVSINGSVKWFNDVSDAWHAIEQGEVIQPSVSVDGECVWTWPDPMKPSQVEQRASAIIIDMLDHKRKKV